MSEAGKLAAFPKGFARHLAELISARLFPDMRLWALALGFLALDGAWLLTSERLSSDMEWVSSLTYFVLIACTASLVAGHPQFARRPMILKIHMALMAFLFTLTSTLSLRLLNYLVMSLPMPMMDHALLASDRWLGLDWPAYAQFLTQTPWLIDLGSALYESIYFAILGLTLIHIIRGNSARAFEVSGLIYVSAAVCIVLGALFPAVAAMTTLGTPDLMAKLPPNTGRVFVEPILRLRDAAPYMLRSQDLTGLTSVPSFHTALGIFFIYCCRSSRVTVTLASVYALSMIATTPVFGGHYFVDLLAGCAFAAAMIGLWRNFLSERLLSPGNALVRTEGSGNADR
jgi:PAP2 superfamily